MLDGWVNVVWRDVGRKDACAGSIALGVCIERPISGLIS